MTAGEGFRFPVRQKGEVPTVSVEQMIEVDRLMVEEYGILLLQMMENAGRCLATVVRCLLPGGRSDGGRVLVLAGRGGNGGGALAAARRLCGWGALVTVVPGAEPGRYRGVPAHQLANAAKAGVEIVAGAPPDPAPFDVIVDGLVGYSLTGTPEGRLPELIGWVDAAGPPVVSLDLPSGLDGNSGTAPGPVVRAAATVTLALPKRGLVAKGARGVVGELLLADIGVPGVLWAEPSVDLAVGNPFDEGDIVRLV